MSKLIIPDAKQAFATAFRAAQLGHRLTLTRPAGSRWWVIEFCREQRP
jgi:hypothetical protein